MTYDGYGNILPKNGKTYTYGRKDLLTAYDGKPITYDAQGNPTSYLGHTLTWEKGRQLKSLTATPIPIYKMGQKRSTKYLEETDTYGRYDINYYTGV